VGESPHTGVKAERQGRKALLRHPSLTKNNHRGRNSMLPHITEELLDIEEKNFLLRKKAFELIKFSAEIDEKLERIANKLYYEEEGNN
jgi:hypothetical protein